MMIQKRNIIWAFAGLLVLSGLLLVAVEVVAGGVNPGFKARLLTMAGIAVGTLISEDLSTISAGLLAATGKLAFPSAVLAAYVGIFVGDVIIYGLGFFFGRPLLRHRWARWFLSEKSVDRAQHLFHRHGLWIIIVTRFLPGTRSATYFAGGALHAPFLRFVGAFALAAAAWTPFLVGLSYLVGNRLVEYYELYEGFALPALLAAGLLLYFLFHYGIPLLTWKGRRRLRGKWIRAVKWEFWPWWQVNWLVFLYVLWLGLIRYRRPTLFTVVNPCMPHGGFIGESKSAILAGLAAAGEAIPRWRLIEPGEESVRLEQFDIGMEEMALDYPVVLKPDEGQRGTGVKIIHHRRDARDWLGKTTAPAILMEFVAGNEYGVFYVRRPGEATGHVTSITIKEQLVVEGNGTDDLETLLHAHPRAIVLLAMFLARFDEQLDRIPQTGEVIPLGELGTHARGAVFRDGRHLITPELEARIDAIARTCDGFYFGRFDIKAADEAALREGRDLKVIELNGLTSEETHIYDPQHGLFHAWGTLCRQWRTAFQIAEANRLRGHRPTPAGAFVADSLAAFRRQRQFN